MLTIGDFNSFGVFLGHPVYKICQIRKAIFSIVYNISQPNFAIVLSLGCPSKMW